MPIRYRLKYGIGAGGLMYRDPRGREGAWFRFGALHCVHAPGALAWHVLAGVYARLRAPARSILPCAR